MGTTRDNNNKNITIAIICDFDGTLTLIPGNHEKYGVYSNEYQGLLEPGEPEDYPKRKMLPNVIEKLKKIYEKYNEDKNGRHPRRITLDAIDFIKKVVARAGIRYGIVSRNKMEYIQTMLCDAEISAEIINQIEIHSLHRKDIDTQSYLRNKNPNFIIIFEDSPKDENEIRIAAQNICPNSTIISFRRDSGKFEWKKRLEEIEQLKSGKTLAEIYPNLKDASTLKPEDEIEIPDNFIRIIRPLGNGKSVSMVPIKPKVECKDPLRFPDTKPNEVVKTPLDPQLAHDFEKLSLIRRLITHQGKKGFNLHHGWGVTIDGIKYSTSAGNILKYLFEWVDFNAEPKDLKQIYDTAREFIENELRGKTQAQHRWYRFFLGDRDESTAKLYRDIFTILNCNLNDPIPNTIDIGTNEIHEDIRQKLAC